MRWYVLAVALAVAIGCGKSKTGDESTDNPTQRPSGSESPSKPDTPSQAITGAKDGDRGNGAETIDVSSSALLKAYKENRVGADGKYTGKRIQVKTAVSQIGRTKAGEAYIGNNYSDKVGVEPSIIYVFPKDREASIGKLKERDAVTIIGTCRGRVDDGIKRAFPGYEFHVRVDGCELAP